MPAKKPRAKRAPLTPEEELREAEREMRRKPPKPPAHVFVLGEYAKKSEGERPVPPEHDQFPQPVPDVPR